MYYDHNACKYYDHSTCMYYDHNTCMYYYNTCMYYDHTTRMCYHHSIGVWGQVAKYRVYSEGNEGHGVRGVRATGVTV